MSWSTISPREESIVEKSCVSVQTRFGIENHIYFLHINKRSWETYRAEAWWRSNDVCSMWRFVGLEYAIVVCLMNALEYLSLMDKLSPAVALGEVLGLLNVFL